MPDNSPATKKWKNSSSLTAKADASALPHRRAQRLALIHEYISRDNPNAARRIITALHQQAQALTQHPQIGKPGQIEDTREQVHSRYPYIIAYRIQSDEIQILGIVHSSRKWPENF